MHPQDPGGKGGSSKGEGKIPPSKGSQRSPMRRLGQSPHAPLAITSDGSDGRCVQTFAALGEPMDRTRESAGLCLPLGYRLDWLRSGCVLDGWLCQSRPALGVLGPRFAAGLRVSVECGPAVEAQEWRQQTGGSSCAAHSRPGVAGLCGLSAFTVISARALHESPRGNGRHRFEPLSSRRGRALLPGRSQPRTSARGDPTPV